MMKKAFVTATAVALSLLTAAVAQQDRRTNQTRTEQKGEVGRRDDTKGQATTSFKDLTDQKFVQMAASGGLAEVKLGQLAAEHGTSDAIRRFGKRMVDDHGKANKELMALAEKKNWNIPRDLSKKDQTEFERLSKLRGAEFDRAYAEHMLKDHEEDVALFEAEANHGQDPDLKAWAAKTLPTLKEHLKLARDLGPTRREKP
jgi:putative membrane protein